MTRAVFPHVPDPADARPLQSPTADEIARIRAALPTGTPIMKGKWESIQTAPRDGRPVWCKRRVSSDDSWAWPSWMFYDSDFDAGWRHAQGYAPGSPTQWFNPEAAP